MSNDIWGRAADDLRDALAATNPAAVRAYQLWKDHIDGCERCGDALAPCTVEPVLWAATRTTGS